MLPQKYKKITFRDAVAELVEVDLPEPGEDQVLVRARCSLISPGTERAALTRLWDNAEFRENPGYALSGDVIATGSRVQGFSIGDRVVTLANHASLALVPADPWVTLKIPDEMDYETATFVVLASVALHAIRRSQLSIGEDYVIIGAGIIGQIANQLARMDGARQVIVLDYAKDRLELARRHGADLTINPNQEDAVARVFEATAGKGASVILEAAGNPKVIPQAFKMAANGGRIVLTGALEEPVSISFHEEFIRRELSLIAAFQPFCPTADNIYWRWTQQANRQLLLNWMAYGKVRVEALLTHRFPAAAAPEAYERIKAGEPGMLGVLLDWDKGVYL